jgi:hypothetical protein
MKQFIALVLLGLGAVVSHAGTYAIVNGSGQVINMVTWDGVTPYNVSPNTLVLATGNPNAQVGGTFSGGVFTPPAAPPLAQGIIFLNSPASGATISLPNAPQPQGKLYVVLTPAASLASLTINLPPGPFDGDDLYILSTKAITTVNIGLASGQGSVNIPASFSLAANTSQHITWSAQFSSWFKL